MECSEAEVLIGMKQHGALSAELAVALDEHLASCTNCRAFGDATRSMETEMISSSNSAARSLNVDELTAQVRLHANETRVIVLRGVAGLFGVFLVQQILGHGSGAQRWINAVALAIGGGAVLLGLFPKRRKALETVLKLRTHEELLAHLQREADEKIRARRLSAIFGVYALPIYIGIKMAARLVSPERLHHNQSLFLLPAFVVCAFFGLYELVISVPRLRRERAGLQ